jgi:hypothetical protein
MSYDEMKTNLPTQHADDGFDDDFNDGSTRSIIQGTKIKFTNRAEWLDCDTDEVISAAREFIVLKIIKVTQKWIDGVPVETRVLGAGLPFPDVEKLNAEAPRSEWCEAFGKLVGPYQNSFVLYLLEPLSMGGFTFPTSTTGGMRAVHDLREATHRARMLRGSNLYPVVTLSDVFMNTQFGGRQRPCFKIKTFVSLNNGGADAAALPQHQHQPGQLGHDNADAAPAGAPADLDDEIPR